MPGGDSADDRGLPFHLGVGHEHVHGGEDRRDHEVRRNCLADRDQPLEERHVAADARGGGFERVVRQRRGSSRRTMGPTMSSATYSVTRRAKLRGSSTRHRKLKPSSTFLMVPNRVQSSSARPREPTRPVLTLVGELHDLLRELAGADSPMGLKNSRMMRLQLAMRAEGLEHGERERDERHQRQQRRVHQAHGIEVDLAARQVAQQRVRITQQPQRQRAGRRPFGELAEQVAVEPVPEREDHCGSQNKWPTPRCHD